jgi:hypothetical protein
LLICSWASFASAIEATLLRDVYTTVSTGTKTAGVSLLVSSYPEKAAFMAFSFANLLPPGKTLGA